MYKGHIIKNLGQITIEVVAVKTLKGIYLILWVYNLNELLLYFVGFYNKDDIEDMLRESSKMCKFEHQNVLALNGVCLDGGPAPFIIMPFMANGSLLTYLKKNRNSLVTSFEEVEEVHNRACSHCIQQ